MNKVNIILLAVAFASAMTVVTVKNQTRLRFSELDRAQKAEIQLEQDYARLQLAQAKLANTRLIKAAAKRQKLQPPIAADTKIITVKQ
ncbi:cell division protein FtsL [Neisseria leonii]|uniref:Cell division protein FtsL n=1 Tax=Neisseria leonii TaxID=2995413 RepID=A0A9X4IBR0_9NEIS|nr:cell division protein FtsL [Neisseria sp. 51.81]MDD9328675.1 cell division protein FtsL [Neisseria sp. 51.81]